MNEEGRPQYRREERLKNECNLKQQKKERAKKPAVNACCLVMEAKKTVSRVGRIAGSTAQVFALTHPAARRRKGRLLGIGVLFNDNGMFGSVCPQLTDGARQFRQFVRPGRDSHVGRALHFSAFLHHEHRRMDFPDQDGGF